MIGKYKSMKGITLIALVITIIILLILAGVTINLVMGEDGILGKAKQATEKTEIASIKEQIQTDILGEQMLKSGEITESEINNILEKYGSISGEGAEKQITTKKGYIIKVADIWKGTTNTEEEPIVVADGSWDSTKNVNVPKLMDGMTGVYWDNSGKEVTVTAENQSNWYNYSTTVNESKWANAKTKDGSYWVWIPRYEYKISGTTVNIKFIPTSTTSAESGYTYVHPAFKNGSSTNYMNGEWDKEISGFWVAKYAAGFQANTTNSSDATTVINSGDTVVYSDKNYTNTSGTNALQTISTSSKISYPVFKPLTYAYNMITTGDSYTIAQEIDGKDINSNEITNAKNFYGLNPEQTDSHMMKNSEWGAVAYLTQSSYGRNGTEVTINSKNLNNLNSKNIYAVTGYSETTANGVSASSTNNMSGVFDFSGCVWERTAAYITNGNSNLATYGSSYVRKTTADGEAYKTLSTKYATVYPYNTSSDSYANNWTRYNGLKTSIYGYGDAILETSTSGSGSTSWNGDYSNFAYSSFPFFVRGGNFSSGACAGAFAFVNIFGSSNNFSGFRVCLAF